MAFSNINVVIDDLPDFSAVDYQLLAPEFAKIRAAVAGAFLCLALVAWAVGALIGKVPFEIVGASVAAGALVACVITWLAWKSASVKRYAVREHDMLYLSGLFWRRQVIQPLDRVQHVAINRGPIEKRAGLASVKLYSAGSGSASFEIPGLPLATAEHLREFALAHKATL